MCRVTEVADPVVDLIVQAYEQLGFGGTRSSKWRGGGEIFIELADAEQIDMRWENTDKDCPNWRGIKRGYPIIYLGNINWLSNQVRYV
jgi:hypothetical protein